LPSRVRERKEVWAGRLFLCDVLAAQRGGGKETNVSSCLFAAQGKKGKKEVKPRRHLALCPDLTLNEGKRKKKKKKKKKRGKEESLPMVSG